MKYALIPAHQEVFSVSRMGRVFEVSRSGFYEWLSRPESTRKQADRRLETEIKQAIEDSRQNDGTRHIQDTLRDQGPPVSRARIGRLMRLGACAARPAGGFERPRTRTTPCR